VGQLKRAAPLLVALVLGLLVIPHLLRAFTDSMLFHPERGQPATPGSYGVDFEEVWLIAPDRVRTQAWWMEAPGATATVLGFHGNAGTMGDRLPHLLRLRELGVNVLAAEYRGYGDSEGKPSEQGFAQDAAAALQAARARSPLPVVVHGRSLGGAVAIRLASEHAVDGLIVESTFTSLAAMAGRTGIPLASRLVPYRFDSEQRIARIEAPVLVVHGDRDELIPLAMGERLVQVAPNARLLTVAGGAHNDTWVVGGARYWAALRSFLGTVAG
jgi:fermentation-respiration switch protein FrsA (DUF1100 family)